MTRSRRFFGALALILPTLLFSAAELQAQTCDAPITCEWSACRFPAVPAPSTLWGELKPAESVIAAERDSTDHLGKEAFNMSEPFWFGIDIENGYIFVAGTSGFEIYDATSSPDSPIKRSMVDGRKGGFPVFRASLEDKFPVRAVDAPEGDDTIMALAAEKTVGISFWDTSSKSGPQVLYQDWGVARDFQGVYATKLRGKTYAFGAATTAGLRMYDMSKAEALTTLCVDEAPTNGCGVFIRNLGTRQYVSYVSGAGPLVASSSGGGALGVDILNVSDPNNPVVAGVFATGDPVAGTAVWTPDNGTTYYLAAASVLKTLKIYDVSECARSGQCATTQPISVVSLDGAGGSGYSVNFSRGGGTPFVYVASPSLCGGTLNQEWLFDVANASAPRLVTPARGVAGGVSTDYWMWYHRATATGFNWVSAQGGKFYGTNFYRVATGLFDVHKLGSAKPVPAFTWSPAEIFAGTPVSFTEQSNGNPTSFTWTFQDGTPASTIVRNPSGVIFSTTGTKTITLQACNDFGCNTAIKSLTVYDPAAAVTGVTVSPTTPSSCVNTTFTATGVSGQAPLTYAWVVTPPTGAAAPIPLACTSNPCTWEVPASLASETYSVSVTVSNTQNPTGAMATKAFSLSQQVLGFVSGPTADPTTTGAVTFHVASTGAQAWAWDFGLGTGYGAYSTDPITGPNPTMTYTASGTYSIKVKIRDCNNQEIEYPTALTLDVTAIPLVASFQASCFYGMCAFDVGTPITFSDQSTGSPDSWSYDWNHTGTNPATCSFGAGSATPTTSHTYNSVGQYQPCVKVQRGTDSNVFVHAKLITISSATPPPTPSVSIIGSSSGTVGQSINFSATASNCSPATNGWQWSTSGGSGSSSTSAISISWSTAGTKTISVSNSNCGSATRSKSVTITSTTGGGTLTAAYSYSPTTIAIGQTVTFDGSSSTGSPTSYSWTFGDGTAPMNGASVQHAFASGGTYQVKLSVSKPGTGTGCFGGFCSDDETKTIVVGGGASGAPVAAYTYSPTSIATGQAVTFDGTSSTGSPTSYSWNFGDGTAPMNGATVQHAFATGGTYQVTLSVSKPGTGTGCFGGFCSDDETKTIVVQGAATVLPVAAFTYSPTPVYAAKDIAFDASSSTGSPTSYLWTFGDGTASAEGVQVTHKFTKAGSYTVKLTATKPGAGPGCFGGFCSDDETKTVVVEPEQTGLCTDDPTALCLNNGRFKVKTEWKKPDGVTTGVGKPVGITGDTGYFWFEYQSNVEIVTKVLDGCGVNGSFWVFAAGLTNIEVKMTVTDKQTGAVKIYTNPQGTAFEPIQDTKAFSCAAANVATETYELPSFEAPVEWVEVGEGEPVPVGVPYARTLAPELTASATCVPDATTLCLNKNRFRVEAWWQTNEGLGTGQAVALGGDTGYFWFFNKDNVELVIKVLDGCALNSRYWVFAGGLTNVGVRIIVTDMATGLPKEYVNPIGKAFPPKQDTDAIAECQ